MIDLPVPTIIRPIEGGLWGSADAQMQRLGLPRHIRRAVQKELTRIIGEKPAIQRATLDDLAKYAGEPKLGTFPFPGFSPTVAAAASPVTYIGHSSGSTAAGAYTYPSVPLTAAAADRLVVVVLAGDSVGNYSTTGVVVGATGLTLWSPGRIQLFVNVVTYLEIYYGIVSSGATPNIVATMTATTTSMDVYCLSGCLSTPVDQVGVTSASGTSCAINNVETKVGGGLIAAIAAQNASVTYTEAWTGAGSVVEDSDATMSGTNVRVGAAHIATTAATSTDDFTFTLSTSKTFVGGAISFGP